MQEKAKKKKKKKSLLVVGKDFSCHTVIAACVEVKLGAGLGFFMTRWLQAALATEAASSIPS